MPCHAVFHFSSLLFVTEFTISVSPSLNTSKNLFVFHFISLFISKTELITRAVFLPRGNFVTVGYCSNKVEKCKAELLESQNVNIASFSPLRSYFSCSIWIVKHWYQICTFLIGNFQLLMLKKKFIWNIEEYFTFCERGKICVWDLSLNYS